MSSGMKLTPGNFRRQAAERIADPVLRRNVKRATELSVKKRDAVTAEVEDWEERRELARKIKEHTLRNLAMYLRSFEENAGRRGSRVLWARSGAEACGIIAGIAAAAGARTAVKSKSMASEEINLGEALSRAGAEPVETDLGEYIVQLAGEMPSHITAPALHKSREEIGRLFSEKLGIGYTTDPEKLTAVAREVLRKRFLEAEIGISGVNFGVADSGAVCIVENEGNARMSTTLPRIHIALMGVEKLLPDARSLMHMLGMLARSATGQRLSCYTSIISGPRRHDEPDGPENLYIVLLDNGRVDLLADTQFREALACIRCGACMNICPVYKTVGGHAYGSVYPGPIGSVLTPVFTGRRMAKELPFASSLCGACAEICPVKIDIHHLLLLHRKQIVDERLTSPVERLIMKVFAMAMSRPFLYKTVSRIFRGFAPLLSDGAAGMRVPVWSGSRDFPMPAERGFAELWKEKYLERS